MNLLNYKKTITSQFGEDGIIEKIFEIIKPTNKWCVEFGAGDGKYLSNTWNLINKGWTGILIESNKEKFNRIPINNKIFKYNKFVNFEGNNTIDNILKKINSAPKDIDLISIDIDGIDYHIWKSLKEVEPKVIIIEFNPTIDNNIIFIQNKDMKVNQGSSLKAIVELGRKKGYELIAVTDTNAIFVKGKYFELFDIKDNSINTLNTKGKYYQTQVAQFYDGTIMLTGNKKRFWKGGEIIIK